MSEQAATPAPSKGMATASLVLGIVSIAFCWLFGLPVVVAIVGLVLGIIARKKTPTGVATAGLVLSIVGIVLNGVICLFSTAVIMAFFDTPAWK